MSTDRNLNVEGCESGGIQSPYKFPNDEFDDDGKPKRTGNVWTASAHIITAIIGSGVLSLAWGVAQLGWIAGGATLVLFSIISLYTSNLLADCYRSPDPLTGRRNCTYCDAVKAILGRKMFVACASIQYLNLCGIVIGYTITASISMVAIQKSNCFHRNGHETECKFSHNWPMIGMGIAEIFISQIPNFHKLALLSFVAAAMSFSYSLIGIGLSIARLDTGKGGNTTLTGIEIGPELSAAQKTWQMFSGLGDIALAYSFALVLIEIQDTLKSSQPENKVMKKANRVGVSVTSVFYIMCGSFGYAAFGNKAPGNLLTGFGFYDPYWLVNFANICIIIHLAGAYQILAQPVYSAVETWAHEKWSKSAFVTREYPITIGKKYTFNMNLFRLTWRTAFVILATLLATMFPFFNYILGLLGAIQYYPLSVFFPVTMYITKNNIRRGTIRWFGLQLLNVVCFLVALAAALGSIQGISKEVKEFKLFQFKE